MRSHFVIKLLTLSSRDRYSSQNSQSAVNIAIEYTLLHAQWKRLTTDIQSILVSGECNTGKMDPHHSLWSIWSRWGRDWLNRTPTSSSILDVLGVLEPVGMIHCISLPLANLSVRWHRILNNMDSIICDSIHWDWNKCTHSSVWSIRARKTPGMHGTQ